MERAIPISLTARRWLTPTSQSASTKARRCEWFETNPHVAPPRTSSNSQQGSSQRASTNQYKANSNNAGASQSNSAKSQTKQETHNQQRQTHSQSNQPRKNSQTSSASQQRSRQTAPNTGWFTASELKLTPLQDLVHKIYVHCSGSKPSFLAMVLGFVALFGPLFVISGTLGMIFPELPGHYPDWLMMTMLGASGWCTCYIFRWFFTEAELIKLQQKELYFRSTRTIGDTVDLAKSIIGKHEPPNASWKFNATGSAQEAILQFEEEVFPDVKRPRSLNIRFEARPGAYSVVFAMQVKATSPMNSFTCKKIAEQVVTDLKKELQEIAA